MTYLDKQVTIHKNTKEWESIKNVECEDMLDYLVAVYGFEYEKGYAMRYFNESKVLEILQ